MYAATVSIISTGVTKPIIATSTASNSDETHSGRNKLNPKNLDK